MGLQSFKRQGTPYRLSIAIACSILSRTDFAEVWRASRSASDRPSSKLLSIPPRPRRQGTSTADDRDAVQMTRRSWGERRKGHIVTRDRYGFSL
ncbi:hypothetical protein H6F74_14100 [Trichocoleus sp. FACHB-90]|uniref:hypothetical protein n=1 Tax=Cyanophyceae TaxID=3028117 RepID=UPI0016856442|nr:hypothetical protein [Trichocoleus sp. FACHB-90]MBD1927366.1 hypothetical protein [Trichocoleus sp. FACHB-90]